MEKIRITDLLEPVQSPAMLALLEQLKGTDILLDRDTILALAKDRLDVELNIDEGLLGRFVDLFQEIERETAPHIAGRSYLQNMAVNGIVQTSRVNALLDRHPEITAKPLVPPLVVAGMPRSGTTYLLQLLSSEPDLLSIKLWEAQEPIPAKSVLEGEEPDQRRADVSAGKKLRSEFCPMLEYLNDIADDEATEEIEIMAHGCYGISPPMFADAPHFEDVFYSTDQTDAYRYLYRYLQALQWVKKSTPDQRWLLKTPQHMGALPSLNAVFPSAAVVFTHRDPASVFSSLITLLGYCIRMVIPGISQEQLVAKIKRMQHGFLRGLVAQADQFEGRCVHIYFHNLMDNIHDDMEKIYSLMDKPYDQAAQDRVNEQAKAYSRGRKGARVVYDIESDFGISRDEIREEFSYYIDKFPVAIEDKQL